MTKYELSFRELSDLEGDVPAQDESYTTNPKVMAATLRAIADRIDPPTPSFFENFLAKEMNKEKS